MKTLAIYHKDCIDGTAAAAVVLKRFPDALLFPMSHGYKPEELEPALSKALPGDSIYTVDCVLGAREFLDKGFNVTSIDHHIGSREEYKKVEDENPRFTYIFDNDRSGASLSWSFFFPKEEVPEVIKLVEDRDLWKWRYAERTENVNNILWLSINKPEEILDLLKASKETIDSLDSQGSAISRYNKKITEEIMKNNDPQFIPAGSWRVPVFNTTVFKSEIGNSLATEKKQAVGLYSIKSNDVRISFRSNEDQNPSALDLAKALGGGGHRNAASAKISLKDFLKLLVID